MLPDMLVNAARKGDTRAVLSAVDGGLRVDDRDVMRRTLLHHATIEARHDLMTALLSRGSDPNAQDRDGWSCLHFASQNYDPVAVRVLLDVGARADLEDSHGNTPLFKAVYRARGRGEIIEALLSSGADPYHKNKHGVSAYKLAHTIADSDEKRFFPTPPPGD